MYINLYVNIYFFIVCYCVCLEMLGATNDNKNKKKKKKEEKNKLINIYIYIFAVIYFMRPTTPNSSKQPAKSASKKIPATTTPKKSTVTGKKTDKVSGKKTKGEIFLEEIEQLNYNQRWQKSVEMGRDARAKGVESEEMTMLKQLSLSDIPYERLVAAMGMTQTNSAAETLRLAKDPCDRVANVALMSAATHLSDPDILSLFNELPQRRFWHLCSSLERRKRLPAVVDQYIASCLPLEKGSSSLALLCWASEEVLAGQPFSVLRLLGSRELRVVGRLHPDFAAKFIEAEVKRDPTLQSVRERVHNVLNSMLRHHPSKGLLLLTTVLEYLPVDNACLRRYSYRFPAYVAKLAINHKIKNLFESTFMNKVEPTLLFELFDAGATTYSCVKSFFVDAPLNVRKVFIQSRMSCLREKDGSIVTSVIESIPSFAEREKEAMRALTEVVELRVDPALWAPYITFLPFKKAMEMGEQALKHKDTAIRANACYSLVRSGMWHPDCLDDVVTFCVKCNRENDVVRRRIFCALDDMPASRWKDQHYVKLLEFFQAALDAKDASTSTFSDGLEFILKSVPFSHRLSDAFLIRYLKQRIGLSYLSSFHFSKSDVMYLWTTLLPWLVEMRHVNFSYLDSGLRGFGSCMRVVGDNAKNFLIELCNSPGNIGGVGIKHLLTHFKPAALELLPHLLEKDPSWIYADGVMDILSKNFQGNLLERYLVPIQFKGCFSSSEKLLVFKNGYLWTGKKQRMYATSIANYLMNNPSGRPFQKSLLNAIKVLYSANVTELLAPLMKQDYKDIPLRDYTIDIYGHLEDEASLKLLLEALGDDRASCAIHALHQRLSRLPGSKVIEMLDSVLHSKSVSLRKEAINILRDIGGYNVYNFLMQLHKSENLHTDVQAALVTALLDFAEKQDVWEVFFESAKSSKLNVLNVILGMTTDKLCEDWQFRNFDCLVAELLNHKDPFVVTKALENLSAHPLTSHDEHVLNRLFEILGSPFNPLYFQPVISALLLSRADVSKVAMALANLKFDLTLRRAVDSLFKTNNVPHKRFVSVVSLLVKKLLQNRRQPSIIALLICKLPVEEFFNFLIEMLNDNLLHAGATMNILQNLKYNPVQDKLFITIEEKLRKHNNPFMQRIGLKILSEAALHGSWDTRHCTALDVYQTSTDIWVSDDAKMVDVQSKK